MLGIPLFNIPKNNSEKPRPNKKDQKGGTDTPSSQEESHESNSTITSSTDNYHSTTDNVNLTSASSADSEDIAKSEESDSISTSTSRNSQKEVLITTTGLPSHDDYKFWRAPEISSDCSAGFSPKVNSLKKKI